MSTAGCGDTEGRGLSGFNNEGWMGHEKKYSWQGKCLPCMQPTWFNPWHPIYFLFL